MYITLIGVKSLQINLVFFAMVMYILIKDKRSKTAELKDYKGVEIVK